MQATWGQKIWQDLQPTPGRLGGTLRIVLASILTLLIVMALQMPFASLGLYVVFFVARDSPAVSMRSSFSIAIVMVLAIALEFAVVIVSDNDPMVRLLSVTVVTFIAGMLMAASTAPFLGAAGGFIFVSVIALWETQIPSDTLVKLSLWLLATISTALGCSVFVEYVFGLRSPAARLEIQRRMRYQALEAMFRLYAQGAAKEQISAASVRVARLGAAGQAGMQDLYNAIVERDLDTGNLPIGSRVRITMLAQLIDVSAAFAAHHPTLEDPALRERCAGIADGCHDVLVGAVTNSKLRDIEPAHVSLLDRVETALHAILAMPAETGDKKEKELVALPAGKVPFLIPGALTRPESVGFALKISLSATVCYILYHALDWPGISTATITVLLTAAGHSGAIKQKLMYRLLGSAIGGLIFGIGATAFVFPYMDSITSLVVLVGTVAFIAAWWAGGRQFSYVGMQIAFSFYLVAFEGPRAPTDLSPPRDRLIGILLALIVMWFVFDQIWPVRTVTAMRRAFASILRNQAKLFRLFETTKQYDSVLRDVDALRDQVGKTVAGLRTMNEAVEFEFGVDRELHQRSGETILQAALTAVGLFWNQLAVLHDERDRDFLEEPGLIELRRKLADHMEAMADAVVRKTAFQTADAGSFVAPALLESPRYGDYAQNAVKRYGELQAIVSTLSVRI
jgi:multidrug resistance protein MdtO